MLVIPLVTSSAVFADKLLLPVTRQPTQYAAVDDGDLQKSVESQTQRFTFNGDCVMDNVTGLMWARNANISNGKKNWQDARDYITFLNGIGGGLCGYTDWRLPHVEELDSLVTAEKSNTTTWLYSQGFTNVMLSYWASGDTTNMELDMASGGKLVIPVRSSDVAFEMNEGHVTYPYQSTSLYVWPVRGREFKIHIEKKKSGLKSNIDSQMRERESRYCDINVSMPCEKECCALLKNKQLKEDMSLELCFKALCK
jgi:hypothetical protein